MYIICRYTFQFYAIANLDKTSLLNMQVYANNMQEICKKYAII